MSKPSMNNVDQSGDPEKGRLSINDRLALIDLISEGARHQSADSPLVADLFNELWTLVDATASGAKIDRLTGKGPHNGFKAFEITAETGENLGRLNMLYLNKPIPCYYLVYVEVTGPFRSKGLGNRILKAFRDFLIGSPKHHVARILPVGYERHDIAEQFTLAFEHQPHEFVVIELIRTLFHSGFNHTPQNRGVFGQENGKIASACGSLHSN